MIRSDNHLPQEALVKDYVNIIGGFEPPSMLWGLDPMCNAFTRLYVKDILQMIKGPLDFLDILLCYSLILKWIK
uniref:Uncharacterized protein n=1 Tax=Oncorhynchus kisutch TaxID=8019 RepID=A0A8C7GD98_ONCKI